ncbi:MAG: bifunctional DNA-formamidopyrimidine glycosylase/DNA-(apurinic or apyrimidinic site) lyase [Candidatus Berkiella sp.]
MPELPEVETTVRGIRPHLLQHKIKGVVVRQKQLRWPIPSLTLERVLPQQTILEVSRRAKYILIETTAGTLVIHLGMSGTLRLCDAKTPLKKHDHFDCQLQAQKVLRYNDPRRFGAILWAGHDLSSLDVLNHLGPEPLSKAFNAHYLLAIAAKRSVSIKQFIMDAKIVVGVGNIYASESLFLAKIHPLMKASHLTPSQAEALCLAIRTVLKAAIKKGGTTLKDFYNSEGKPGYFRHQLTVYDRDGLDCIDCKTPIEHIQLGQRATYYCPQCQIL